MRKHPVIIMTLLIILMIIPWIADLRPNAIDLREVLLPPSRDHWFGTDENGRDVFHRILAGAQTTLIIGISSTVISIVIGSVLGAIAGYFGSGIDDVIMRTTDLALALPTLFVILVFSTLIRPGIPQLIVLIGLTGWMPVARIIRGSAREISTRQFVLAAESYGASREQILRKHILPNLRNIIAVSATIQLSRSILTEATISFLGVGIQPPDATWGSMLSSAQSYLLIAPWLAMAPGIALSVILIIIASTTLDHNQRR